MLQNLFIICLFFTANIVAAQSQNINTLSTSLNTEYQEVTVVEKAVFFTDVDESTYYVDFEAIGSPIAEISLRANNEIILLENTLELPANTIYGIDLSKLKPGSYSIELVTIEGDGIVRMYEKKEQQEKEVKKDK